MKYYEMLCVLPGTLTEEEVTPLVNKIKEIITSQEAEDLSVQDMGKSRLAYPIKDIRYGYFQLLRFQLEPDKLAKLEKSIRLLPELLRLVVNLFDPSRASAYKLAQDPTALSAPKPEERRERRFVPNKRQDEKDKDAKKTVEPAKDEVAKTPEVTEPTEVVKKETEEVDKKESVATVEKKTKKKVSLSIDDIDQKLDEILQHDIDKV